MSRSVSPYKEMAMPYTFRKEQRILNEEERTLVNHIKEMAQDLHDVIDMLPSSRARDIAKDRLQECVMWTMKAIADAL
jgi:hypothetical protein